MDKPILCVDFDGVIHSYTSGWQGEEVVADPPVPGALDWLWAATKVFDVHIYSSRSKSLYGRLAMFTWVVINSAKELGPDHPMAQFDKENYPLRFSAEKPAAFLTIDDRALRFDGDWAAFSPADLLNFKPWNKKAD